MNYALITYGGFSQMARTRHIHICNTLEKPKYLRANELVKFLTCIIIISSKFPIY